MKDDGLPHFSLDEVIRMYKTYNESLGELDRVLADIYQKDIVPEYAYEIITGLPEFVPLYISPQCIADIGIEMIIKSVEGIFHQNVKDLTEIWKITESDSKIRRSLIHSINSSHFSQSQLLKGLQNIIQSLEKIAGLQAFYMDHERKKNTVTPARPDPFADSNLDYAAFMDKVEQHKDNFIRIELIQNEIKRVKEGRLRSGGSYADTSGNDYLTKLHQTIQIYLDDNIIRTAIEIAKNISAGSDKAWAGKDNIQDMYNKEHTLRRKVIAVYMLLREADSRISAEGNKKNMAGLIHFITGNSEENIYKIILALHAGKIDMMRKDYHFVADEFFKVKLDVLASELKKK